MTKKNSQVQTSKNVKKTIVTQKQAKFSKIQTKKNKKDKLSEQQQIRYEQQIDDEQHSSDQAVKGSQQNEEGYQDQSQNEGSDDQEDSEQESSQSQLAPENYAIKQMQFRERRGTKMNYLMSRKKEEEEDSFWQNQGQDYFGNLQNQQDDQDYQQSSSGRDQFDSDFNQTQSEHQPEENKVEQPVIDEEKQKQRKKQQELMRKIGASSAPADKKQTVRTNTSNKKNQSQKKPVPEVANRYIHQVCTQQQLLGQAAQTQYINWLSLQKLISLQNQKKDFTLRQHFLDGQKIIFRDRINAEGKRSSTYELVGVSISKVSDLTDFINKEDPV